MLPLFIVWVCCVGSRVESDDETEKESWLENYVA